MKSTRILRDPLTLYPITRDEYNLIADLLPVPRRYLIDPFIILNAITYCLYHCVTWRSLNNLYEYTDTATNQTKRVKWGTIYRRFKRWQENGYIQVIYDTIRDIIYDDKTEYAALDSTAIKAATSTYPLNDDDTIGRNPSGRVTKVHVITSNDSYPYMITLTRGNKHDCPTGEEMLENLEDSRFSSILADKAYTSKRFRRRVTHLGSVPCVPPKRNTVNPWPYDEDTYRNRVIVENFFAKLKRNKHLSSRFDRSAGVFLAFIQLHCITSFLRCRSTPVTGRWKL